MIPAAGLGTRFLPATKAQPKEMLPVVDKPGIQYVVEEAVRAGLDDIVIVTGRGKGSIEDHFDRSLELEAHLERTAKTDELEEVRRVGTLADVHFVRQKEPLGLGHAVLAARAHVGDEPFVVMVADEIVPEPIGDERELLTNLIEGYRVEGASVILVQEVPHEDVSSYGIVTPVQGDWVSYVPISDMIEKPAPELAPSNLASRGRYLFAPQIFDELERTSAGVGGEIQLTDAIRTLAQKDRVLAYIRDEAGDAPIYDVGKKIDYLRATVELALRRDDLAKPFQDWLRELAARLG